MKRFAISIISFYQIVISPLIKQLLGIQAQCRYSPTCSTYAKQVISEYGIVKGTWLAGKRLLSCQPFANAYGHN